MSTKAKTGTDVIQLINLLNSTSTSWMDTNANQAAPPVKTAAAW